MNTIKPIISGVFLHPAHSYPTLNYNISDHSVVMKWKRVFFPHYTSGNLKQIEFRTLMQVRCINSIQRSPSQVDQYTHNIQKILCTKQNFHHSISDSTCLRIVPRFQLFRYHSSKLQYIFKHTTVCFLWRIKVQDPAEINNIIWFLSSKFISKDSFVLITKEPKYGLFKKKFFSITTIWIHEKI